MSKEVIVTAKTVEEAMDQARKQYGGSEYELSFDILEMPKKGFLGFGAAPAKIKVTITKALDEVDLSDLVSEIRSMKHATDFGGDTDKESKENKEKKEPSEPRRDGGSNRPKNDRAPRDNRSEAKPQQPKAEAKPQQPKAEAKPQQPKTEAADDLPAALRPPQKKNEAKQKPRKPQPKARPRDERPEEEKKKDLLSAVMGIGTADAAAEKTVAHDQVKPAEGKFAAWGTRKETASDTAKSVADSVDEFLNKEIFTEETEEVELPSAQFPEDVSGKIEHALENMGVSGRDEPEITPDRDDEPHIEFVSEAEMQYALDFAQTLLRNMDIRAEASAAAVPEGVEVPEGMAYARIEIVGVDTAILIGHHGETLDALQYLVNLSGSRRAGTGKKEFVKIVVDIENYRAKREETLRALARRMAAKAIKYKRNMVLEPMNPYERRII
ncbi:MAG: Jag N-terminal domain-containing protein, partial [Oscillospiraceae bacterium]|nr:Jag N-terminal domain-containing protein [Oscillospiraceae bacterium]